MNAGLRDYGLLILLALIWASSFLFIKLIVDEVPPVTLTWLRTGAAVIVLFCFSYFYGKPATASRQSLAWMAASGLLGVAVPFCLISRAQAGLDVGLATLLMGLMPLVTILMAHFATQDEKLNARKVFGVVLGFIGLIILFGGKLLEGVHGEIASASLVLLACVLYAVNALMARQLTALPPLFVSTRIMVSAFIFLIPMSFFFEDPLSLRPGAVPILIIILLGVLHTGIATMLLLILVRWRGASFFAQINYLIPPIGIFYGWIFLGESLELGAFIALAVILLAIFVARSGKSAAK